MSFLKYSKEGVSGHLQPAGVEEELQQGENRNVHVKSVTAVTLLGIQKLSANDAEGEKGVNCNGYHLYENETKTYRISTHTSAPSSS